LSSVLIPIKANHAGSLYPLVKDTVVTDTLIWNGPTDLEEYRAGLREREQWVRDKKIYMFTIIDPDTSVPVGSIDITPGEDNVGELGLWIGEAFQGKGLGSKAINEITQYVFQNTDIVCVHGHIFIGNEASKRAFEKAGFIFSGIVKDRCHKNGVPKDAWRFTIEKA